MKQEVDAVSTAKSTIQYGLSLTNEKLLSEIENLKSAKSVLEIAAQNWSKKYEECQLLLNRSSSALILKE
jgi:hypothetical protein